MIRIFILTIVLFLSQNETFNAKVIGITDGDSIIVLKEDNTQVKVRFEGIDCPEMGQDYGEKAKQATVQLCFKKNVKVIQTGVDRYGRMLANVYVDDISVNKELIRIGMAWHYKKFNSDPELAKIEVEARDQKVGLWSQQNPAPPWEFRLRGN